MVSQTTHPTVESTLDRLPDDAGARVALDDMARSTGYPTGKVIERIEARRESRHVRCVDRVVVHTGDGSQYVFSRHSADEPWAYEVHVKPDGDRSQRRSHLPESVERVAMLILRDVRFD